MVSQLAAEFAGGQFDLDPCATPESAKASAYYTEADDGLSLPWHGKVFMNPPYSPGQPAQWIDKAISEVGCGNAEVVVALMQSRTDTKWFHKAMGAADVMRFRRGRIQFERPGQPTGAIPYGNTIFVFRGTMAGAPHEPQE